MCKVIRVWNLFDNAGFNTKPNTGNKSEHVISLPSGGERTVDLLAIEEDLDVKIIGWNKATKDFKEAFSVHLHDYERLMQIEKANTVLFVSTCKEVSILDKQYAKSNGMNVWGLNDLEYYEALVDAIGHYAKYEIIHSFGISTNEEKDIKSTLALHLKQPFSHSSVDLFLFTATPQVLLKTSAVFRRVAGNKDAYQRILQKKRLNSIRKFVTQPDALLPPNIIVHFGDKVQYDPIAIPSKDMQGHPITITNRRNFELVLLSIPMEYASLEVIDGQHRLYGFAGAEADTKENFNLVVLGIANLLPDKKSKTFVAINDNARRMDPNLVAYLKLVEDEAICQTDNELMAIKVVVELSKIEPFRNKIRLLDIGDQIITLKGFVGYDLKGLIGPRGLLRKYLPNTSGEYVKILNLYFINLIKLFPEQWKHPEKYIIFTNRGISAFLKLLKSMLKTHQAALDEDTIKTYLKPIRDKWVDSHWEIKKMKNAYVGSTGWKGFHRDLVKAVRSQYKTFQE
jgi:DGQHR domain-containing protein